MSLNIFFWSHSSIFISKTQLLFYSLNRPFHRNKLSESLCSHLSLCFHPKRASRKILPQQKCVFAFLPGQTVAIVLKVTLPPAQRSSNSCRVLSAPSVHLTDITYSWFSILCICSLIWSAEELLKSSFLAPPPSLSDTLNSSPSPSFSDCPLLFLVRRFREAGGVGTWRENICMSHSWDGDIHHCRCTWKIGITSSLFLCWATSQRRAVMSIRRQISMSTFMAFSWILLSRSDMSWPQEKKILIIHI